MGKRANDVRLTVKAIKAGTEIAKGSSQVEAWRTITPNWEEMTLKAQHEASCRWFAKPQVRSKVNEILQNSSAQAQINTARYIADTMALRDLAAANGNWNAAMAGQRLIGQAGAILKDSGTLTVEHSVAAEKLVEQLKSLGISPEAAEEFRPRTSFSTESDTKH